MLSPQPFLQLQELRYGADGCVPWVDLEEMGCCPPPPPLCGNDLCCTFVAFFNLLPSGPLWDYWKAAAISYFQTSDNVAECPLVADPRCPSLVLHAIYVVLKLKDLTHNALWPALRESNPYTAITTLDDHLTRLQWEDCFAQHCRSVLLGELTPYEIMGACGPVYFPPDFPDDLECALRHNIAVALTRAQMKPVKNLCGLNWIIEPLGAEVTPIYQYDSSNPCGLLCTENPTFEICTTRDWIAGCGTGTLCETNAEPPRIAAWYDRACDMPAGLPAGPVWPALLSAECIVRSILPPSCPPNITRCCV